jgi:glycerol-3-phosphate acyltransferase PlsX
MRDLTLALDVMGGDLGPHIAIKAAVLAVKKFPHIHLKLVGQSPAIQESLALLQVSNHPQISIEHAESVVTMEDNPITALRRQPRSSMRVAIELVKSKQAHACISSGNTGALVAMSKVILGTLEHMTRPALITPLPQMTGRPSLLLDIGANLSCDSETLTQFAMIGHAKYQVAYQCEKPRVALLNVGIEACKGTDQIQQAAAYLASHPEIDYIGFIEGSDLFSGVADVIVCDGFVGNVVLKSSEGLLRLLQQGIPDQQNSWLKQIAFKIFCTFFKRQTSITNPDSYNGASLIGLNDVVIKSHGAANEKAIYSAICHAMHELEHDLPTQVEHHLDALFLHDKRV